MEITRKAFDPTVKFSFFGSWVTSIESLERADIQTAYRFFKAIAHYAMYEEEPDFSDDPILYAVWATVEREIDLSVNRQKVWFAKDGLKDNYKAIKAAIISNPGASLRAIADMTGTDKNMVSRVKKKYEAELAAAISDKDLDSGMETVKDSVSVPVSNNNTDSDCVNDIDNVNDNDSTGRDRTGQTGQMSSAEIDPLTCSLSDWMRLPDEIKKEFTLFDRMRVRFLNMDSIIIDNTSPDAIQARDKWGNLYDAWRQSIVTEDVQAILDRYLSEHEESPALKKMGDKYGRIIDGWNEEQAAPNIVYSHTYFPDRVKHNLTGIPVNYYRTENEELSIEEERQARRDYYAETGIDTSAYEVDNDGEMPF